MRITGGSAKGRVLAPFKGRDIRPTSDQVREAIFNILGQCLEGKMVLDLFAGTGALGIEALSRGARKAVFIDSANKALDLIKRNIKICGFQQRSLILKMDLRKGLPSIDAMGGMRFDIVFIDPPYRRGFVPIVMSEIARREILMPDAKVVVETANKEILDKPFSNMALIDVRNYGDTRIHIFGRRQDHDQVCSDISWHL